MAAIALSTYNYTSGNSDQVNRQIQFVRPGNAASIIAQVYVLDPQGQLGALISAVQGNQITVEMQNTIQKAQVLFGRVVESDKLLSSLTIAQQNAVLGSLRGRYITIGNYMENNLVREATNLTISALN